MEYHVGVSQGGELLGLLVAELCRCDRVEGNILEGRGVGLEDVVLLPLLLVLLLGSNEGVTLVGLRIGVSVLNKVRGLSIARDSRSQS
jgi:hypothetical protein